MAKLLLHSELLIHYSIGLSEAEEYRNNPDEALKKISLVENLMSKANLSTHEGHRLAGLYDGLTQIVHELSEKSQERKS